MERLILTLEQEQTLPQAVTAVGELYQVIDGSGHSNGRIDRYVQWDQVGQAFPSFGRKIAELGELLPQAYKLEEDNYPLIMAVRDACFSGLRDGQAAMFLTDLLLARVMVKAQNGEPHKLDTVGESAEMFRALGVDEEEDRSEQMKNVTLDGVIEAVLTHKIPLT